MKDKLIWAISAVSIVWIAVIIVSILSQDFIHGSDQQHFPLAASITWISGAYATKAILTELKLRSTAKSILVGITISTIIIWVAVILVSLLVPSLITGTDPTQIPIAPVVAPIAGAIATGSIGNLVRGITEGLESD